MSRRQDTPVPEFNHARKTPQTQKATPTDAQAEVLETLPTVEPVLPKGAGFAVKDELAAAMQLYKRDGICPLCNVKLGHNGRGIAGHVSKCLRLTKFKTASMATS